MSWLDLPDTVVACARGLSDALRPAHPGRRPVTLARRGLHATLALLVAAGAWLPAGESRGARAGVRDDPFYLIDSWDIEDGLPDSTVSAVTQTPDGFLWLATFGGLTRFDGTRFAVHSSETTPGWPGAGVVNLHADRRGRLWVSTLDGLAVREGDQWRSVGAEDGWAGDYVRSFSERANGDLLFTTFDGHVLAREDGRLRELPAPPGEPGHGYLGAVDESGRWWVAQNRFVGFWDGDRWVETLSPDPLLGRSNVACTPARDGGVWVLLGSELRKFRGGRELSRLPLAPLKGGVWSIVEDSLGNVWICSYDSGLYRVAPDGALAHWTAASGLDYYATRCVFEDREGILWIGTSGGGLRRFLPRRFLDMGLGSALAGRNVRSVSPARDGGMWVATYDTGLFHHDGGAVSRASLTGNSNGLTVLEDSAGGVWFGDLSSGWRRPLGQPFEKIPLPPSGEAKLIALFEDSKGRVWLGEQRSLRCFENGSYREFGPDAGLPFTYYDSLAEDRDGAIWAAGPQGLYRFDGTRFAELRSERDQPLPGILCLRPDPDGSMWIGTRRDGLWRWREGRIARIGPAQSFPAFTVLDILPDLHGHFWITTDQGIVRAARADLRAVADGDAAPLARQLFDRSDGLPSVEFPAGQPTSARDAQGRLWFATLRGLAMVDPASFRLAPVPPKLHIERLAYAGPEQPPEREDGRPANLGDERLVTVAPPFVDRIELPPGTRRIEIAYGALAFRAPERVRFQVRLEGASRGWDDAGNLRAAHYYDLRPGDYLFRLRAANSDDIWSEHDATLAFTVRPHLWQTLWFRTAIVLLLLAAGGAMVGWQTRRRHRRKLAELEQFRRQQAELAHASRLSILGELSASMAHELNQPLTAILANSQAAQRFMANDQPDLGEFREILKDIASDTTRARDVIRNLRALVKKSDFSPAALDLDVVIREVVGFLHGDVVNRNVTVSLGLAPDLPPVLGDRVQLQQVLLNLLLNAFDAVRDKPAAERVVTISTQPENPDAIRVTVCDRGAGIAADELSRLFQPFYTTKTDGLGMGLSVTRSIVEAHRGRIWAEPNRDAGMSFHFTVPLAETPR